VSTILIVEDSAYQRAKLARLLKAEGHDLIETANAEDGLEALKSTKPDCIMLDLLMPGMGGLGFLKVYGERQGQAPIVVLTADIQETTRESV